MDVTRRQALHRLTALVGGAVGAPAMSALLSGCRAEPRTPAWTPETLTDDQVGLLEVLVDAIIPATDTAGAKDAGVVVYVDKLLTDWVEPDERARFLDGLGALEAAASRAFTGGVREASPEQLVAFLTPLDEAAVGAREAGTTPLPFFATLKEWTVVGYYTSEVGATQELQWLATPGRYDGDVPLEEVGRTWA